MNVTFRCPKCQAEARADIAVDATGFACPACHVEFPVPADSIVDGQLQRCLICPSTDLFVRKDFSPRLGVWIVTTGFILSTIAYGYYHYNVSYAILFATALVDVVLYFTMGDCLNCYRCQASYRATPTDHQGAFDLSMHERYRQQAARLAEATRGEAERSPSQ